MSTPLRQKRLACVLAGWLERCEGRSLNRYSYGDPVIAPDVPEARLGLFVMQWGKEIVAALERLQRVEGGPDEPSEAR